MQLAFIETTAFTRRVGEQGLEEDLRELQQELLRNPEKGALDPGTGGLRKVRMRIRATGKGKSSGARVHYLWLPHRGRIYLMFVFGKNEASTLTADQKKKLREVVARIKATDSPKE